jgi:hypothetical protein
MIASQRLRAIVAIRSPRAASAVLLVLTNATIAWAAEPAGATEKPVAKASAPGPVEPGVDDELLKDLDNELLEGAGDLKAGLPQPGAAGKPGEAAADVPPIDGEDVGMPGEQQDPLLHVSQEMRSAEEWIPQRNRRTAAEQVQQRIVENLTRLIQQAEQQQQQAQQSSKPSQKKSQSSQRQSAKQSQPSSGGQPGKESTQPAQDSTERMGKARQVRPDAEMVKSLMKDTWGHLPERDREQVLQHSPEQFLPQYELMIERYYKRLAEEQRAR